MAHSHCPPPTLFTRSAKMIHKEDTQADCAFSLSLVSPSSCWQTPLLLGTLTRPHQYCVRPSGCWHSKQQGGFFKLRQWKKKNLHGLLHAKLPKKDDRMYDVNLVTHSQHVFNCKRLQHLLFELKIVSVHIWHRSNFPSVGCSETEIPDVKNVHLGEVTAQSTSEHQLPCALTEERTITA